jgi:hypothetical protein
MSERAVKNAFERKLSPPGFLEYFPNYIHWLICNLRPLGFTTKYCQGNFEAALYTIYNISTSCMQYSPPDITDRTM